MPTRTDVYAALDTERAYQEFRWNPTTTTCGGQHTVGEWLVYIQNYTAEAMNAVSRNPDPQGSEMALSIIRKITAMGVAAMEQLGAPKREGF